MLVRYAGRLLTWMASAVAVLIAVFGLVVWLRPGVWLGSPDRVALFTAATAAAGVPENSRAWYVATHNRYLEIVACRAMVNAVMFSRSVDGPTTWDLVRFRYDGFLSQVDAHVGPDGMLLANQHTGRNFCGAVVLSKGPVRDGGFDEWLQGNDNDASSLAIFCLGFPHLPLSEIAVQMVRNRDAMAARRFAAEAKEPLGVTVVTPENVEGALTAVDRATGGAYSKCMARFRQALDQAGRKP